MPAAEETHWAAWFGMSPFGDEREDLRAAQITQAIVNTNVKKGQQKRLEKFLLFPDAFKKHQGTDSKVLGVFGKLGAMIKGKKS